MGATGAGATGTLGAAGTAVTAGTGDVATGALGAAEGAAVDVLAAVGDDEGAGNGDAATEGARGAGDAAAGLGLRGSRALRARVGGGPGAQSARTVNTRGGAPSETVKRQAFTARSRASPAEGLPSTTAASWTSPWGPRAIMTEAVSAVARPGGKGGAPPLFSSGMPGARCSSGSFKAKVIDCDSRTFTGLPVSFVGSYSQSLTAFIAASSRPGMDRVTRVLSTRPSSAIRTSRMTIPRIPSAAALAGYSGATYFFRAGTGTSWPASFASTAFAPGAAGPGEGVEAGPGVGLAV